MHPLIPFLSLLKSFVPKKWLLLLFPFLLAGCGNAQPTASSEAQMYLEEVFQLLETRSIRRNSMDWPAFRKKILYHARNAQTLEDTYPTVVFAIQELGDKHSYFEPAKPYFITENTENAPPPVLPDEPVPNDIGYIRVRYCMGNEETITAYRNQLLTQIQAQDKPTLKGWVVDLRGNFGGNMWPMLAGLSPFFNDATLGYFMDPEGHAEAWRFKNGNLYSGHTRMDTLPVPYTLSQPHPYIAVLTDTSTASSGEAIAVAFKGHPRTKSFGQPTYGVSTGNQSHTLSDGSRINLSETVFADRHKTRYGNRIYPDWVCNDALAEAIRWLNETAVTPRK